MAAPFHTLRYYLADHPSVVGFRWSHAGTWGSTWSFLFTSLAAYIFSAVALHHLLRLVSPTRRRTGIPLCPIPAAYSLCMAALSFTIFLGTVLSAAAEIRETRWLWRRWRTTAFEWLLCFPVGTRPSGRVFFWSYVYYLSRFIHALRPFIGILRRRRLSSGSLLSHSAVIFTAFLWLEFSQSFQVVDILTATLVCAVAYGYRFWTAAGLPGASFPVVVNCQIILLSCNVVCHVGVLPLHFIKGGGCNGIGAWIFNSFLNVAILYLFVNFYVKIYLRKRNDAGVGAGKCTEKVKDT
ncbi:elongation of fatty acids protein 3-like [Andrographis paniculata]|uniref:elongation of fatty acids protein 3-like n=1 Tax=Andrographis paniculata TaxID=175694 RepID=UPI0021E75E60|nr:elongation of fatty acids protein 3-like [Andrographis paniculata]